MPYGSTLPPAPPPMPPMQVPVTLPSGAVNPVWYEYYLAVQRYDTALRAWLAGLQSYVP